MGCSRYGLREQILVRIATPLIVGLITTVVVSCILVSVGAPRWVDMTKDMVLDEAEENLSRIASAKAALLQNSFTQTINEMNLLAAFISTMLSGYPVTYSLPSFPGISSVNSTNPPGGLQYSERHLNYVNTNYSFWYLDNLYQLADMTDEVDFMIQNTSVYDLFFKALYNSDPLFTLFIFVFDSNTFMRDYPFKRVDGWITTPYTCPNGTVVMGYNPKCRPYYADAYNAGEEVSVPRPYISASSLPVMSPGRAIYLEGRKIGIISADITMTDITNSILSTKILNRGYAYVMDSTGTVYYHPQQNLSDSSSQNLLDLEFGPLSSANLVERISFNAIYINMTYGYSGRSSFMKRKELWYIAYEYVPAVRVSLAVVVPDSDVSEPATDVKNNIVRAVTVQAIVFLVVILVTAVGIGVVTWVLSRRIIQPVLKLTRLTERLARGDLEMGDHTGSLLVKRGKGFSEIGQIARTFDGLLTVVKFGNSSYLARDWVTAMKNYNGALDLFCQLQYDKGIGLCYNNIGNVYYSQKKFDEAREYFQKAIIIAEKLASDSTLLPEEQFRQKSVLATRLYNLAVLEVEVGKKKIKEINADLLQVLAIDLEIGHILHYATHAIFVIELFIDVNKPTNAGLIARECYQHVIVAALPENASLWLIPEEIEVAKQYAFYGMGLYWKNTSTDIRTALSYFVKALECGPVMDTYVHGECLKHMSILFEQDSFNDLAGTTKKMGGTIRNAKKKEVVIVMDHSSSMAGERIKAAIKNLRTLFNDHIYFQDSVGFYVFSKASQQVFELQQKNDYEMLKHFDNESTMKGTALYDALFDGFKELKRAYKVRMFQTKEHTPAAQWLIVLTDGKDTRSTHSYQEVVMKARHSSASLLIIGILLENPKLKESLRNLCLQTKGGVYIDVDATKGIGGLDDAFRQVTAILNDKMHVESLHQ